MSRIVAMLSAGMVLLITVLGVVSILASVPTR